MKIFIENFPYPFSESQRKALHLFVKDGDFTWIERKACLCESKNTRKIYDRDRYDLKLPIMLCEDCGLIFFAKILDEKSMQRYYNRYFAPIINYQDGRDEKERFSQYKFILPHVLARCLKNKLKILDIGTSSGKFLTTLANNLAMIPIQTELSAFEIDKKWRRSLMRKRIRVVPSLTDDSGPYDLIILSHVLEHLAKPFDCLKLLRTLG